MHFLRNLRRRMSTRRNQRRRSDICHRSGALYWLWKLCRSMSYGRYRRRRSCRLILLQYLRKSSAYAELFLLSALCLEHITLNFIYAAFTETHSTTKCKKTVQKHRFSQLSNCIVLNVMFIVTRLSTLSLRTTISTTSPS